MAGRIRSFARFYALLAKCPSADKESLVMQFTDGRTASLREMTEEEYEEMCAALEEAAGPDREYRERLRRLRSSVLLRIGRLGISTVDNWDGIDAFCLSPRIAGKEFRRLSAGELEELVRKLESILRKGGLRAAEEPPPDGDDALRRCMTLFSLKSGYLS